MLAEFGAVPDVVLRGEPVGELGQHLGEFRVDRGAVVALHEVLDDELPVRLDVVADPATDAQVRDVVVVDRLDVAEPIADVLAHRVVERGRVLGQAHPHVAEPLPHRDAVQAVLDPVDVGHLGQVRRRDELAVQVVGPGVVGHWKARLTSPLSSVHSCAPRCRQTLKNARTSPLRDRVISTLSRPTCTVLNARACRGRRTRTAQNHIDSKIFSCSIAKMVGSV